MGKVTHPMVQHFWEEHGGRIQPVLMRVTSKHLVALERQVRESINIEKCGIKAEECLNLKNEWAGSKIPGLSVTRPKGVAATTADVKGMNMTNILEAAIKRGIKRIDYLDEEEEDSKEPEEAEEEIPDGSEEKRITEEMKPPDSKRHRKVEIGDGREKISPIKWRCSPIGKTFASINIGGKGREIDLELETKGSPESNNRIKEGSKMTPVRRKVRISLPGCTSEGVNYVLLKR